MRHTTTTTLAAFAAALLALTACSSSDDSDTAGAPAASSTTAAPSATAAPAADPDLAQAVMDYTTAYFAGDADTAYEALSDRCQKAITPEAYAAVVKQASADYGPDHPATAVQTNVRGELARVSYRVEGLPKLDQKAQPWAFEVGDWKYDAC